MAFVERPPLDARVFTRAVLAAARAVERVVERVAERADPEAERAEEAERVGADDERLLERDEAADVRERLCCVRVEAVGFALFACVLVRACVLEALARVLLDDARDEPAVLLL